MARGMGMGVALLIVVGGLVLAMLARQDPEEAEPTSIERDAGLASEVDGPLPATADDGGGAVLQGATDAEPASAVEQRRADGQGPGTLFTGTVLDAEGEPAAGAGVEVVATAGVVAKAEADEEGAFRFRLLVTEAMKQQPGTVRARGADGAAGHLPLFFASRARPGVAAAKADEDAPRPVGTIRLGPAHAFDVRVVSSCSSGLPATLWLVSSSFSSLTPWSVTATDAQGAATLSGVPSGTWMLIAAADGCGRVRALVKLPRETTEPVELELPEAHVLTVRVRDAADGAPIEGAMVSVRDGVRLPDYYTWGALISSPAAYTTDAEGVVRVEGLGGWESLYLRAEADGYPKGSEHSRGGRGVPGQAQVKPGETEALIELHKAMVVRWPIKDEGIGIPADGTEVVLEPWTNTGRLIVPPTGVIENGEVVVEGWGPDGASGYAVIPGAGIARLSARAGEAAGYPTAFYPFRRIDLIARLPDGSPAEGWYLIVRDGGNNEVKPAVKTDAEGRAAMEGLYGGGSLVNVSVSESPSWGGFRLPLGSVDLRKGDGHFEVDIPRERTLRIRLTIQGRTPPDDFHGMPILNHRPVAAAQEEEEEPEAGVYVVRWRPVKPEGQLYVSAKAYGYLAEQKTISLADLSDASEVVIDLRPAGAVRLRVKEPEDKRYRVTVQRWNEEDEAWGGAGSQGAFGGGHGKRADANGVIEFTGLEPGRYRALEPLTGLSTSRFDVPAGGDPVEVSFDLAATGWVRGRVVLPDGVAFSGVSVGEQVAEAAPSQGVVPSRPVNGKDGTFWIRVPGDRSVTLRIFHPTLAPHPSKGMVTVTKPREGVELHAVRGVTATIRFSEPPRVYVNPGQPRSVSVRLYEGEVRGAGIRLSGVLDGEHKTVVFGGYEPGTYTVWIDAPNSAPIVLNEVALGTADTDLGEVELSRGATLEIQVQVKEGQSPPRFAVWVGKLDKPTYSRSVDGSGPTLTVRGIGAGRFRVNAMAYNGAAPGINEEIEFDGETTVIRTIDAR